MKTVKVPAITREVLDEKTCDFCQGVIEGPRGFQVEDIQISARTGEQYPECGSGERCEIDLCLGCFKNKLIPFIESGAGTVVAWEEWNN